MADSKLTALTEISVPALEDLFYTVDDPAGTPVSNKVSGSRLFGESGQIPGGRLTLTTGVPVTTADVSAAGTIYYTPYLHNLIRIYDGTRWKLYTFTERSLALTLTSGKNYDVFIYDNAGTLTLELSAAWTTDTARADALTTQDSVQVKSGATTRLWLGTIRASAANVTEDSAGGVTTQVGSKRLVWNAYNRVPRSLHVTSSSVSWSYTSATVRIANGGTAPTNCCEFVIGAVQEAIDVNVCAWGQLISNSARAGVMGVGLNSSTAFATNCRRNHGYSVSASNVQMAFIGMLKEYPQLGYNYVSWLESGADGTCQFNGNNEGGISGVVLA